jgi:hypothetical protein
VRAEDLIGLVSLLLLGTVLEGAQCSQAAIYVLIKQYGSQKSGYKRTRNRRAVKLARMTPRRKHRICVQGHLYVLPMAWCFELAVVVTNWSESLG